MSAENKTFSPAKVRQPELALEAAWDRVSTDMPSRLEAEPAGRETRDKLARAIFEAASNGITDTAEMTDFALRALPKFRKTL